MTRPNIAQIKSAIEFRKDAVGHRPQDKLVTSLCDWGLCLEGEIRLLKKTIEDSEKKKLWSTVDGG